MMGPEARREYAERMRGRYAWAGREERGRLLDEYCAMMGCHRKSAVRVLNAPPPEARGRPGPEPIYGADEFEALKRIWLAAEQPCGKRLKGAVALWLPGYARRWALGAKLRRNLLAMSAATMDRMLAPERCRRRPKGLGGTRPGSLLKSQIPIRGECWDEKRPGYMEADTVAHCGPTLSGDFIWSLTFTDIATGWTENAAVWNKGAAGVKERLKIMEEGLPFKLLGFDCDNGSEFLNHHLWSYLRERDAPVDFTRSRPYKKNDQAHVEQKNWTHVRELLGYERLGWRDLVEPINELYRLWGLQRNFHLPTLKLKAKTRQGARIKRVHETAQAPCQRLLASERVNEEKRRELGMKYKELDPFDLAEQIEAQLRRIDAAKRRLDRGAESAIPTTPVSPISRPLPGNTLP